MKYYLIIFVILFTGCTDNFKSVALCQSLGYKGVVSEANSLSSQVCSNGELVNGNFLTDIGALPETYNVKAVTYTRKYTEFKEVK